jgi:hypothetical protein
VTGLDARTYEQGWDECRADLVERIIKAERAIMRNRPDFGEALAALDRALGEP